MTNLRVELQESTHPDWVHAILADFDSFLQDHANCERKASALAMSLVVKAPERERIVPTLIAIAREELAHFESVYALMRARNLPLVKDEPDPYVNALLQHLRSRPAARFLDRLLIFSLVECRGAERFGILARALPEPALRHFYKTLWGTEAKHGNQFVEMALACFDEAEVYRRANELADAEATVIRALPWRASLH